MNRVTPYISTHFQLLRTDGDFTLTVGKRYKVEGWNSDGTIFWFLDDLGDSRYWSCRNTIESMWVVDCSYNENLKKVLE